MLNKQKGNMYKFVTHTWNVIKGKCPHDCKYCYMKSFPQGKLRFDEKELKTNLGNGNYIFVGSSCDMFADKVPEEWISQILFHCKAYPKNTYLFQTKNPSRFNFFKNHFPDSTILGTTIETNRENNLASAPLRSLRVVGMKVDWHKIYKFDRMVTIEPIMDFDVVALVEMIKKIKPKFVNIGADSKGHNLPEPSWEKVEILVKELKKFTDVNLKDNLKRLKKEIKK